MYHLTLFAIHTCRAAPFCRVTGSAGIAGRRRGRSRPAGNVPAQPTAGIGSTRGQTPWCACHPSLVMYQIQEPSLMPHNCNAPGRRAQTAILSCKATPRSASAGVRYSRSYDVLEMHHPALTLDRRCAGHHDGGVGGRQPRSAGPQQAHAAGHDDVSVGFHRAGELLLLHFPQS